MDIKALIDRIEELSQVVAEKENELQLLKDDIESIRLSLESELEHTSPANEPTIVPIATPESSSSTQESESAEDDAREEAPISEEKAEEVQHEVIIRAIEAFTKDSPKKAMTQGSSAPTNYSEQVGATKLNDLKKAMGINDRFLYSNELFNGDMSAFTRAIEELNHLETYSDATRLIEEELAEKYNWNEEDETVLAFKLLVSRRFA